MKPGLVNASATRAESSPELTQDWSGPNETTPCGCSVSGKRTSPWLFGVSRIIRNSPPSLVGTHVAQLTSEFERVVARPATPVTNSKCWFETLSLHTSVFVRPATAPLATKGNGVGAPRPPSPESSHNVVPPSLCIIT